MKIKIKIIIISCLFLSSLVPTLALTSKTTTGSCPKGSALQQWTATWTYDDKGHPQTGAGIDCDGNPWSKDLRQTYNGNLPSDEDTTRAWISNYTSSYLEVAANKVPLSFRIINIQTGNWMSDVIQYASLISPLQIDISQLGFGIYGLVVIYNNSPIQMIEFSK